MVPMQAFCTSLAVIGITGIYAAWTRYQNHRQVHDRVMRERVAYLLWVAATRA